MNQKYEQIRKNIVKIAKKAYEEKMVAGTSGNVSVYDPELDVMGITPSNLDYTEMTKEDIVIMKLNGEIIEGNLAPSSEWQMHAVIYEEREDVFSVVHTHSPRATSFAVIKENIPVILVEMLPFIHGDIPISKFAMPGTRQLGLHALESLEKRNACLLENHGVLAIGKSAEQAYIRAVYVEDAAKICHFAKQIGDVQPLDDSILAQLRKKYNISEDQK